MAWHVTAATTYYPLPALPLSVSCLQTPLSSPSFSVRALVPPRQQAKRRQFSKAAHRHFSHGSCLSPSLHGFALAYPTLTRCHASFHGIQKDENAFRGLSRHLFHGGGDVNSGLSMPALLCGACSLIGCFLGDRRTGETGQGMGWRGLTGWDRTEQAWGRRVRGTVGWTLCFWLLTSIILPSTQGRYSAHSGTDI